MALATDFDLLFHEPALLAQCRGVASKAWSTTATVAGTAVAVPGATFTSGVPFAAVGMALYFPGSGASGGVVQLTSDAELQASLPTPALEGAGGGTWSGPWVAPTVDGSAAVEAYTFPQLRAASERVLAELGLDEGQAASPAALRRACCHAALATIFRSMAAIDRTAYGIDGKPTTLTPNALWQALADAHEASYGAALRAARVAVDRDEDGVAEVIGRAGVPRVVRR